MTYAVATDIEDRLGNETYLRVFDRDGDGIADVPLLANALEHAAAAIDVELRGVYTLPLPTPTATHVKDIAVDLAIGWAVRGTPVSATAFGSIYKDAMERLRRLRSIGGSTLASAEGTRETVSFVITDQRRPRL
jgi:phage gp36-like protein